MEKIASGLLNPFLAHLKTAQDQIAKGGYSILLEPEPGNDRTWFTKGTVERFVRFVSTPEILERVYTIESEILQIEEAIVIQGNNDMGLSTVEDKHAKPVGSSEGDKTVTDANEERAIVLYKPDSHPPKANGSIAQEGNSKVQLLKVLETRKSVLQKEQGMAFARAVAAGFDIDHMAPLVSFAECFGASRLMDACSRFVDLWKGKHETGQWLEIEAAETMSNRSDFSAINASGIMLSSMANKQNESHGDLASEDNGQAAIDASAEETRPMDHQVPVGQQGYFQGPFPHPMFPPWPVQSPPVALPVFQPYPVQGMPYYQSYPGNGPFYRPPYTPMEDSRFNVGYGAGQKKHTMDSRDSNVKSEAWEMDATKTRSHGDSELESEASQSWGPQKKSGRSGKKKSGMVVIRNINYITSKGKNSSGNESQSASDSETDKEAGDFQVSAPDRMHKNSLSSKRKRGHGYDPTLDYEMQAHVEDAASLDNRNKEVVEDVKQGSKKSDKDRKSKVAPDALDKKTGGPIRKGKTSKMSPLDDARARAEKLRAFKVDLQKMKKEKEEEDRKRLEALKMEREKRIAAKGSSTAQLASSQKTRKQLPTKLALSSVKGTKFSDSEPGSSSPLQRSKIRTASTGSSESHKASKSNKSSNGSHLPGNRSTRSVSSLPEPRKENSDVTPDPKVPMARIQRLPEPKTVSSPYVAPVKSRRAELVSKPKLSNEPERKDISAIINLDKSKAATLPELKIRTSKVPLNVGRNTSAPKEMTQKVNVKKSSLTSGSAELNRNNDQHTHQSDVDDKHTHVVKTDLH